MRGWAAKIISDKISIHIDHMSINCYQFIVHSNIIIICGNLKEKQNKCILNLLIFKEWPCGRTKPTLSAQSDMWRHYDCFHWHSEKRIFMFYILFTLLEKCQNVVLLSFVGALKNVVNLQEPISIYPVSWPTQRPLLIPLLIPVLGSRCAINPHYADKRIVTISPCFPPLGRKDPWGMLTQSYINRTKDPVFFHIVDFCSILFLCYQLKAAHMSDIPIKRLFLK